MNDVLSSTPPEQIFQLSAAKRIRSFVSEFGLCMQLQLKSLSPSNVSGDHSMNDVVGLRVLAFMTIA